MFDLQNTSVLLFLVSFEHVMLTSKILNLVKLIWLSKAPHLLIFILFDKENKECPG